MPSVWLSLAKAMAVSAARRRYVVQTFSGGLFYQFTLVMNYTNDSRVALAASCANSALSDFISEVSDFSESFTLFRLVSGESHFPVSGDALEEVSSMAEAILRVLGGELERIRHMERMRALESVAAKALEGFRNGGGAEARLLDALDVNERRTGHGRA